MSDSPVPSVDTSSSDGNTPSYAQDGANFGGQYAAQAPMGNDPFMLPDFYGPFYPQPYFMGNPYMVPFAFQNPFFGQPFDIRSLNGPFRPMSQPPSMQAGTFTPPIPQSQPENPPQSSQPMQSYQKPIQVPDPLAPSQPTAPATAQSTQSGSSHPSVQVVVQPSQAMPPVQSQRPAPAPAPSMQSMPTGVLQPVGVGAPYNSGFLYPPQSSPFFDDYPLDYDPELASGGRIAGSTFLGILSIPFSVVAPLGLLFSTVGLHLANTYVNNGGGRGIGNFARFLNVIGLILTIVVIAAIVLYVGYSAGQGGFQIFGQDPIVYVNSSEPMQFVYEQWNKLKELWPW